jgi:aryl-alcohol dehydrogenase-like predicted oxidoreductase
MPIKRPTYKANHNTTHAFSYGGRIVCGTSGLGGVWGAINPDESVQTILYALENGIRAFDTAPSYANAELYLGMALKEWKGERPFISTKAGRKKGENAFDFTLDYSSGGLEQSLHQSLTMLGLEYIDLLFLHEPQFVPLPEIERIIKCLHGFKEQGLVRSLGIGGNPTPDILPFIKKENFDAVSGFLKLDACNLSALETELPILKGEGIAYYAASSLHFSLLGNRLDQYIADGPDGDWITQRDIDNALKVKELASFHHIALSSLAQRYLFSMEEADRVVVGARNAIQMQNTIQDWNEGALPEQLFETITDLIIS